MAFLSPLFLLFFIFLDWHRGFGQVLQNTTIDDSDPGMRYIGDWRKSAFSELDEGGEHMLTGDLSAQAIFEFSGVAVYFLSPLWPYDVTTQVQLDSRPPEILNLRDFNSPFLEGSWETVKSRIVWAAEGLESGRHTLKIAVGGGQVWAIVDGFIVTSVSPGTTINQTLSSQGLVPTTTFRETTSTTISPHTSPSSSRSGGLNILAIGLGGGVVFLALLIAALLYYLFRRKRGSRRRLKVDLARDFPSFPKAPRGFALPPLNAPTPRPPVTPQSSPVIHSPQGWQHNVLAFAPRQPRSTLEESIVMDIRRTTLDRPPPGYYESVSANRRSNRWTARFMRSVPHSPDPPPLPLYALTSTSQVPENLQPTLLRNKS